MMQAFLYRCFLRYHIGRTIGVGFFAVSLFLYRSFARRSLWDRWSHQFFALIIVAAILFLVLVIGAWRARMKPCEPVRLLRSGAFYLELAILVWGIAYFMSALDDPANAALITTLNVFGTTSPVAACLQWCSLVLACLGLFISVFTKLGRRRTNVLVSVAALVAVVTLLEGVVRFRTIIAPVAWDYPAYSSILWERYYVKFNRQVFRDDEHAVEAVPGTRRLLMIGDPFAFGFGIKSLDSRMDVLIGRELTRATNEKWETINMSHGGTNTLDHLRYLQQAQQYRPDVVLLLYAFNDMNYLCPPPPRREFYGFGISSILFRNSYLFQEAYLRLHYMRSRYPGTQNGIDPYNDSLLLARHMKDLSEFVTLAERGGTFVRIVPFDIRLSLGTPFRDRYERFVTAATAAGIPVLSLENVLSGLPYSRLTTNRLNAHPNELANQIGADAITAQLLKGIEAIDGGTK